MPFDISQFRQAGFQPRTAEIEVPSLADFFPPGEKPIWKVRGLTGIEAARMRQAAAENRDLAKLAELFAGGNADQVVDAIRERFGVGDSVPDEVVKHQHALVMGSVDPAISYDDAIKLNQCQHGVFMMLVNAILRLTAEGHELGKPVRSIGIPESG